MVQLYCIVLAGGLGSNLWPLSRAAFPKQMLKIDDDYTLFQRSFLNLANLVNDKNIITAVNVKYASNIKEQLKELQEKFSRKHEYKLITEPIVKNTLNAVAITSKFIDIDNSKYFTKESPIILVVPSDEIFSDRNILSDTLEQGIELAKNGFIVSYGTKTKEFNTNMTYFKVKRNPAYSRIVTRSYKVTEFIDDIKNLNSDEDCYVNTGIYMFSYETFLSELKKYSKDIYSLIIENETINSIPSISLNEYSKLPDISIEDGLIANTNKLAFLALNIDWKDIGSWKNVYEASKKDENGNCISGKVVDVDSKNSLVYSTDKLIATLGLEDKIVISTEDAAFICDKNNPDGAKKIYTKLNEKNSKTKEIHKTVYRPWGYYTVLENGEGFLTKCITVNPNAKLSVQKHFHRSEHWIILEGEAVVTKKDDTFVLKSGESVDIDIEEIHSLENKGTEQIKILEVQQGDIIDENDIERIEDIYGRV